MSLVSGPQYGVPYTLTGPDGAIAVFNDSTSPYYAGILVPDECSGLDGAEVRENMADRTEQDGAIQGDQFFGKRPVVLTGVIPATTTVERNEMEARIKRACNAMRADATLTWTPDGGEQMFTKLRKQTRSPMISGGWLKKFQIAMVAADPRLYSTVLTSASVEPSGLVETNYATNPSSETTNNLGNAGGWVVTRPEAAAEGITAKAGKFVTKHKYESGVETNAGFVGFEFPSAGTWTVSIYCYIPAGWNGGNIVMNAEGYSSASEPIETAAAGTTGVWQRVSCKVTVTTEDLVGNIVLRVSGGLPSAAKFIFFDAMQIEKDSKPTEYFEGTRIQEAGRKYDKVYDFEYGAAVPSGTLFLTNQGDGESPPLARIYGPGKNPSLINNTTGQALNFVCALGSAEEYLEIDFFARTVKLNGEVNRYSALQRSTSEWWYLQPDQNEVRIGYVEFSVGAKLTVFYRDAWI